MGRVSVKTNLEDPFTMPLMALAQLSGIMTLDNKVAVLAHRLP